MGLSEEIAAFHAGKARESARAGQRAALLCLTGVDLDEGEKLRGETRVRFCRRLERLIERERQKGVRRPWAYDLNRHIALKQALDALRGPDGGKRNGGACAPPRHIRKR